MQKIAFRFQHAIRGPATELLWADAELNGFRLRNIPFYAVGVSLGDLVSASDAPGTLTFASRLERGGHSTYRLLIDAQIPHIWPDRLRELEQQGCTCERLALGSLWLIALDVPSTADLHKVHRIVQKGEAAGNWQAEEADVLVKTVRRDDCQQ